MSKDSRSKMVEAAASLIASRGVNAASFSEVLDASGAPRGSIYHHFPEGKSQLAAAAVSWTSGRVLAFQRAYDGASPRGVLERFIGMWRRVAETSHGQSGCVVAGVAIDSVASDTLLLDLVRSTFREWVTTLATQLSERGVAPARAEAIATATVAGMEGALILCRAEASAAPLDLVATQLLELMPEETP